MLEIIVWISCVFVFFTYVGYPVTLRIVKQFYTKPEKKNYGDDWPRVSVVIAAKNEAQNISPRIKNILGQDYPQRCLEIIVISDGSKDRTVEILQALKKDFSHENAHLHIIEQTESKGKPSALNAGLEIATGTIVLFADARQEFAKTAIRELVANFIDPQVGCVSGELQFLENHSSGLKTEMGAYWHYEKNIRKMESASGSVMGATGAIYAIRKELYEEIPVQTLVDDVLIPLHIIFKGYRVLFDQSAIAYDIFSDNIGGEWRRKVRTLAGNWQLIGNSRAIYISIKSGILFRFFWHKVSRLLVPFFLIALLIASLLAAGWTYSVFAMLQVAFYCIALLSYFFPLFQKNSFFKLCYFFCVLNLAAVVGFWVWISGKLDDVWK